MVTETSKRLSRAAPWLVVVLVVAASALLVSGSPDEKHIAVYSNVANYSLPVAQRNGIDYVGLLEIVEPLGTVSARVNGARWKFRNNDFDLPAVFVLEANRGLVPVSCLGMLLPRILGGPVAFNPNARRLFIGNVAVHFTAQVRKTNPPTLVMDFTS